MFIYGNFKQSNKQLKRYKINKERKALHRTKHLRIEFRPQFLFSLYSAKPFGSASICTCTVL